MFYFLSSIDLNSNDLYEYFVFNVTFTYLIHLNAVSTMIIVVLMALYFNNKPSSSTAHCRLLV